jgi:hypothetical protein
MYFHICILLKEACAIPPEDEDEGKVKVCERRVK